MTKSESIKEIATALAKAQVSIKPAVLDKRNPHFNSNYASLTSVQDACKQALSLNGLSITQSFEHVGDATYLETTLLHLSGEWISSKIKLTVDKNNMQGFASATTYARRIGLASMVGVVDDEDDDGNGASKGNGNGAVAPSPADKKQDWSENFMPSMCPTCGAEGRPSKYDEGKFYCSEYKNGCKAKW